MDRAVLIQRSGPVITATLDRPRAGNTLSAQTVDQLHRVLDAAESDADLRAVVLRARGEAFCSGMDLLEASSDDDDTAGNLGRFFDLLARMTTTDALVISLVAGRAVGGGVGLAAASDLVIATDRAHFSLTEALWGLLPCAVLPFLVRRTGFQRAYAMTIATTSIPAARAAEIGLVDELTADLDRALLRLLDRTLRVPPGVIGTAKAYFATITAEPGQARAVAIGTFSALADSPAFRDAVTAYARHGRFPWQNPPTTPIDRAALIPDAGSAQH